MTCAEAIAQSPRPILVLAHTDAQIRVFARTHRLAPNEILRAYSSDNLRGRLPRAPRPAADTIFLLPSWMVTVRDPTTVDALINRWTTAGGSVFECRESDVLGFGEPGLAADNRIPLLEGITSDQFNDVFVEGMHNYARRNYGAGPIRAYIGRNQSRTLEEIAKQHVRVSDARLKGFRRTFHSCAIYVVDADDHLEFS